MYRIGEFSKISKTTIRTLRYYDEIALLRPKQIDQITNYRFYTTEQLIALHKIQSFRQIGLSIDQIKLILSGSSAEYIFKQRKAEILADLAHSKEQLSRIEFMLTGNEAENFMNYHATIKALPECIVYSKEMIVPNYDAYFDLIPAIGRAMKAANPDIQCTLPAYCFIIYLDSEYKEKDIHVEYCEAVDRFGKEVDGITFKKMESVTAVSIMHKGAYAELPKAYAYLFNWIKENEYLVAGNPRESYIDGVWNEKQEKDWLTELQVPVIKKQ